MRLRSLIRDSSSQRETRLSITTRTPLARTKWDGGKDGGREKKDGSFGERMKVKGFQKASVSMGQWRREIGQAGREHQETVDQK